MGIKAKTTKSRGAKISAAVAIVLFLAMLGFMLFKGFANAADVSTLRTDSVTIVWDAVPHTLEYELWVNNKILQPIYGRSEDVFVSVPHGTNCFKMRRVDLQMRYSDFTKSVCLKTRDLMDIFIPFSGEYI